MKLDVALGILAVLAGRQALAQTTTRASLGAGGVEGNAESRNGTSSDDGRFVAYWSYASNLVPGDTNGASDIFVRDRVRGTTERISVSTGGDPGDAQSTSPWMTPDARFVVFESLASNLVPGDTNGRQDLFLRDRANGTTRRLDVAGPGAQANHNSALASLSADGRYVAFLSFATNLVPGGTSGSSDVYLHDREAGTTVRASVSTAGATANELSWSPSISADGRCVVYHSPASNLVPGDTNANWDVFVRDRVLGTTERASLGSGGVQAIGSSTDPSISADGRFVAFFSTAANLGGGGPAGVHQVYLRDRVLGVTELVSRSTSGAPGDGNSHDPRISADGRSVAFHSLASNLAPDDGNATWDVFVRDRVAGTTTLVSAATGGVQGSDFSLRPAISAGGRFVAFYSPAPDLVGGDENGVSDVFVFDRSTTGFPSLCEPGREGVRSCPCSNPASGAGHGCDNSAATGGASLAASGEARLSSDTVVFTSSGETPTALTLLLQGDAYLLDGTSFGRGVRCAGGSLKRLFARTAAAGNVVVPDFGSGDPSVSARSAARGDAIQPGQSRWYLAYYRDAGLQPACSGYAAFNTTPSRQATWAP